MYLWVIEEWESRDVFLRYDFCFPAFLRRSWEEEPGWALEWRVYVRGSTLVGLHSMCEEGKLEGV